LPYVRWMMEEGRRKMDEGGWKMERWKKDVG
jgi:hypothetical protein